MTELDYILHSFDEHFAAYRNSGIALYPGEYLDEVIRNFDHEYRFCSILPADCTEVPEGIDAVILTDHRIGKEPDYNRICTSCREKQIPLLDLFGLDQIELHNELHGQRHLPIDQWKELLGRYDVISLFIPNVVADYDQQKECWVLRRRFPVIFEWLKSHGKTVVVFWEHAEQLVPLKTAGYAERADIRERTGEDLGFLALAEKYAGKRIIHVGVGTVRDGIVPREYGIHSRVNRYFTNRITVSGDSRGYQADRQELITLINRHDVISFDIFDTLLKRTVLHPKDVFALVEKRTGIAGFAESRYSILTGDPHLSFAEIYDCLKKECGYDDGTLAVLQETELQTEREVIRPRHSLTELFAYAVQAGKTAVLVSDMYLDEAFIRSLLDRNGIRGYSALYVSCEYGMLKQEGLFDVLKQYSDAGCSILHIGDDRDADCASAEACGLDAAFVPSCLEMARLNGYAAVLDSCSTPAERSLLGLGTAAAFDDPFRTDPDLCIAAMIVFPLVTGYLQWACRQMAGHGYDRFLLSSRDGKLLLDAYNRMRFLYPEQLPEGTYFYTNRHAAFVTVMDDRKLTSGLFSPAMFRDDPEEMMRQVFSLSSDRVIPYGNETPEEYIHKHSQAIHEAAETFRNCYREYLRREGLETGRFAIMDFVSSGSSQRLLEHCVMEPMDGLYVGIPEYISASADNIRYYLDQDLMNYDTEMKLEVYFTSLEPALDHIGPGGVPVFAPEVRSPEMLNRIRHIHDLVQECLNQYLGHLCDPKDEISRELVLRLCGLVNQYSVENCYYDDMTGRRIHTES